MGVVCADVQVMSGGSLCRYYSISISKGGQNRSMIKIKWGGRRGIGMSF